MTSIFRGLLETGAKQKVNAHLHAMGKIRDSFARPLPGSPSTVVNDPRTKAARAIYTQIDAKVRELMDTVTLVTLMTPVLPRRPKTHFLKRCWAQTQQPEQHSQQTAFEGVKGAPLA